MKDGTSQDGKLQELAGKLGEDAAARLDVEATAQAVLRRLRERLTVLTPMWARPAWLRIAAALVVLLGGGLLARGGVGYGPVPAGDHYIAEDLTDLTAADLRQLLASLDETLAGPNAGSEAGLEDLNEQQLREVLRALEG